MPKEQQTQKTNKGNSKKLMPQFLDSGRAGDLNFVTGEDKNLSSAPKKKEKGIVELCRGQWREDVKTKGHMK